MPKINAFDEAVIDGSPLTVYRAVLNEGAGVTHWWMPHLESRLRGEPPADREGAVFEITIHGRGTPRFSERITKIVEAKFVETEIKGDFAGTGTWTFDPTDGKTKVGFRWNVKPKKLSFVLLSPSVDMGKSHSGVVQKEFKALRAL